MKIFLLTSLFIFVFVGCSNKQYFEPNSSSFGMDVKTIKTSEYLRSINSKGATLENSHFIDQNGISKYPLPKGFEFVNNSNGIVFAISKNYELLILNSNEKFKFKSNVIAVDKKDNLLALVFANNSIGLYDIKTKQFKLKKYYKKTFLNDTRIAMPKFLNKVILFPILSGKVIVVDKDEYKVLKTITIDPLHEVRNIILLEAFDNTMIAASPNKIITIENGNLNKREFFIQGYIIEDQFIYIATHDGRILKLDLKLNIINEIKFKFAKLQALALGKKHIYAIESQSYIIKLSKDFKNAEYFDFPFEEDEKIFVSKNKIYVEDKILILK